MFKIGDKLRIKHEEMVNIGFLAKRDLTVIKTDADAGYVYFDGTGGFNYERFELAPACAAASFAPLLHADGAALTAIELPFSATDVIFYGEGVVPQLEKLAAKRGCDCGGLKTYGIVSRETCSSWCSASRT